MHARVFDIVSRRKQPLGLARIEDFQFGDERERPATEILHRPCISLYCFDFSRLEAVFVETPEDLDLRRGPFYYRAQFESAIRVWKVPAQQMIELANGLDDPRLILVHSVGRAGSTLAGQLLGQADGTTTISEPDALTWLVIARSIRPEEHTRQRELTRATVRMLCKAAPATTWAIKGRSYVIELADWLHDCFPHAHHVFLHRDPEDWLRSAFSAFGADIPLDAQSRRAYESGARKALAPLVPLLAGAPVDEHLTMAAIFALMWLSVMQAYRRCRDAGIRMLPIDYASWKLDPMATAAALLQYCGVDRVDLAKIEAVLASDSQADSVLARERVRALSSDPAQTDFDEMRRQLCLREFLDCASFIDPAAR